MSPEIKSLCDAIRKSISLITLEWIDRVKSDPSLRADDPLSLAQLIDHVPEMLEELCVILSGDEEPDFQAIRASSTHGYARALAGYSLVELLRELELLRDCVFNFVADYERTHEGTRSETVRALRIVNQYFGEDIIFVVEHYLQRMQDQGK